MLGLNRPFALVVPPAGGLGQKPAGIGPVRDTNERQVLVGRVDRRRPVPLFLVGITGPGPGDDRPLGVQAEEVAPALPVAVPQLGPRDDPVDSAQDDPPHDRAAGEIRPDHGVGPVPDQRPHRAVVAVHHPAAGRGRGLDPGLQLRIRQRDPVGLVDERVQLDVRNVQDPGQFPRQPGLARAGRADHGDPPHDRRPYQRPRR